MTKTYNIMNYEPQENGGDCEYTTVTFYTKRN